MLRSIGIASSLLKCVNLSRRQHLRNALFDALRQLSGTHYRKLFSVVTLLQFLSLGLRHSSSPRLSLLSLLTNTLPGPSASEVTTLRRITNLFIIIIIIIIWDPFQGPVSCQSATSILDATLLLHTAFVDLNRFRLSLERFRDRQLVFFICMFHCSFYFLYYFYTRCS